MIYHIEMDLNTNQDPKSIESDLEEFGAHNIEIFKRLRSQSDEEQR